MRRSASERDADRPDLNTPHGRSHAPRDRRHSASRGAPDSQSHSNPNIGPDAANPKKLFRGPGKKPAAGGGFNTDRWT
jgi:hypothetical protein